jgi:hypothetical protein
MEIRFVNGAAELVADDNSVAVRQPCWPDGTPWESEEQAIEWLTLFVESLNNPESLLPGDNPNEPTKPRPAPEEVEVVEPEALPE